MIENELKTCEFAPKCKYIRRNTEFRRILLLYSLMFACVCVCVCARRAVCVLYAKLRSITRVFICILLLLLLMHTQRNCCNFFHQLVYFYSNWRTHIALFRVNRWPMATKTSQRKDTESTGTHMCNCSYFTYFSRHNAKHKFLFAVSRLLVTLHPRQPHTNTFSTINIL